MYLVFHDQSVYNGIANSNVSKLLLENVAELHPAGRTKIFRTARGASFSISFSFSHKKLIYSGPINRSGSSYGSISRLPTPPPEVYGKPLSLMLTLSKVGFYHSPIMVIYLVKEHTTA